MIPVMPNGFVPEVSSYTGAAPGGIVRTEVGGGASRYRVDWARGRDTYNVRMTLDPEQFSIWSMFYHHIVRKGSIAFLMRLDSGLGTSPHAVNITPGSYQASANGAGYVIAFSVETENAAYALDAAQVAAYGLTADSLPAGFVPTVAAYSFGGPAGVTRDEVAGGVAGYGLEWNRGPQQFSCTLILTPKDMARWTIWFHRLVNKGARTFTMRLDSGMGLEDHDAAIVPGSVSTARTGGIATVVSFVVEAESKIYEMSAATAEALIALYNASGPGASMALARQLAKFATVDSNVLGF
jgi:hypothetical protein